MDTRIAATLAALIVMATAAPAALAQEPAAVSDPAAEKIDKQIGDAVFDRPRVWVDSRWKAGGPDALDLAIKGTFNLDKLAFFGRARSGFVNVEVYSTSQRALGRLPGAKCWKTIKQFSFGTLATLGLGSSDPRAWEADGAVGPAVFSIKSPQQVQWTLGGTAPVTMVETYNPVTMLPLKSETVQQVPATATDPAYTAEAITKYKFNALSWKPPRKPKRCR